MEDDNGLSRLPDWQPLRDRAYDAIKSAILTLALKPGEPLVERTLASRLGISKTPIRGALVRLEREGLVTMTPFKGAVVTSIYKEDIREIFELREALEGIAARLAVDSMSDEDCQYADSLITQAAKALSEERYTECSRYGSEMHEVIMDRAGNKRLESIVGNLDDQQQRFRLVSATIPGRLAKSMQEHRGILNAIQARDGELAERLMRGHLHGVLDELMSKEDIDTLPARADAEHV